jgi:hypothetical protein
MSTQYRLVQSGETASGGCSAGQGSSEPVAPRIIIIIIIIIIILNVSVLMLTVYFNNTAVWISYYSYFVLITIV